ncbi:hypothetical protein Tco_1221194 [Tanacetum coccineum]
MIVTDPAKQNIFLRRRFNSTIPSKHSLKIIVPEILLLCVPRLIKVDETSIKRDNICVVVVDSNDVARGVSDIILTEPGNQNLGFFLKEDGKSEEQVKSAVRCFSHYDPTSNHSSNSVPFCYWKIRDFAYSYSYGRKVIKTEEVSILFFSMEPQSHAGHVLSRL